MVTSVIRAAVFCLVLTVSSTFSATFTWTGARCPAKTSQGDGISGYPSKIGTFSLLTSKEDWGQFVFNVNNRFPSSKPWATWAVGTIPENITPLTDAKHNEYLSYMDQLGVSIFLELIPTNQNVVTLINDALTKFGGHSCVEGIGIDLEYYSGTIDAKAWDDKAKTFKSSYRFYFKHWETAKIPTYRGKGDFIYICTSSEGPVADLTTAFGQWATAFAPSAVAFQIGYPADEDAENGTRGGWAALTNPILTWGNQILAKVTNATQEVGILWVTVKSGKSYNTAWDLTKGATLPSTMVQAGAISSGQFNFKNVVAMKAGVAFGKNHGISVNVLGQTANLNGKKTAPGIFIYNGFEK
jgi:hypothetical protein